jgi:hypothetical protein
MQIRRAGSAAVRLRNQSFLETRWRRLASKSLHDEGHREGGPGIRYQNAFFRLAQKENATATPFVRGVITGAIERRALLSAPGAR